MVFIPENVCSRSVLPTEQLRRHVSGIPLLDIIFYFALYGCCVLLFELKQQPEVRQLEAARVSNKDVCRLEVQMHKTMRVQVMQR